MTWMWAALGCAGCAPVPQPESVESAADSALVVESAVDSDSAPAGPPNLLLVIADDFGVDLASFDPAAPCYDHGTLDEDPVMPTLARLCEEGVVFTEVWAQPTCSPSRASMLTGRLPYRTGVGGPVKEDGVIQISPQELTLPTALALGAPDYTSASFGKWHLSIDPEDPNRLGWSHFSGLLWGALDAYDAWEKTDDGARSLETAYHTTWAVDEALHWVDRQEGPWLVWLAFAAPHTPFHVPPRELHDRALAPYDEDADKAPYVQAMSEAMDAELGRLLDELDARGQLDNTVIVFVGDNGTEREVFDEPFGAGRQKGTVTAGGVWVPLIVAGPGIAPRRSHGLVGVEDLFPTLLELAGVDVDAVVAEQGVTLDGRSLVPRLRGENVATRDFLTAHLFLERADLHLGDHAIRDERMGLVCTSTQHSQLYDLTLDPYMTDDLSDDPAYASELVRMRSALRTRVADSVCPNDEPE